VENALKARERTTVGWVLLGLIIAGTLIGAVFNVVFWVIGSFFMIALVAGLLIEHQRKTASRLATLEERIRGVRTDQEHALRDVEGLLYLQRKLEPDHAFPPFHKATINPDFAHRLVDEIFRHDEPVVVELGSGVSTVLAALAVKRKGAGRVVSYEAETRYHGLTSDLLKRNGVGDLVELHFAPLKAESLNGEEWPWYDLPDGTLPEKIDVLLVDGPPRETRKDARYPAVPLLYERLRKGSIVYLDDGRREDENRVFERWQREFTNFEREYFESRSGVIALRKVSD
jgi:predicted O-methyltransferase YrrM